MAGQLTITDLDDFLTPSQACIIPVRNGKAQSDLPSGETEIHIDNDNNYYEVSTYATTATLPTNSIAGPGPSTLRNEKKALEKAEINLNDCLACSGCITSTESLLITLQSQTEVLAYIASASSTPRTDTRSPVLSISPQTLASLSAAYAAKRASRPIPLVVLLRRIRHFLSAEARGGWRVWDTTFARHLSLRETVNEFEERRAAIRSGQVGQLGQSGQGGEAGKVGLSGESRMNGHGAEDGLGRAEIPKAGPLPMLASACPGWVCYAEKAQADLLPLLSNVRSSQAISGALVKQWWATRMGIKPEGIYHVSAMPCYDKKLEASRSDFYSELHQTRDIDCVLTTGELDLLLSELSFDPYAASPLDDNPSPKSASPSSISSLTTSPVPELLQHPGTISGSYLHTLLTHFALSHPSPTSIYTRQIRDSPDNEEYILYDSLTGEPIFKGAKVYGFRNLQNLVRKVGKETGIGKGKGAGRLAAAVAARRRKGKPTAGNGVQTPGTPGTPGIADASTNGNGNGHDVGEQLERMRKWDEKKLDFVEVMACPSGCVNGGGQMKPVGEAAKATEGVEKPCNGSNAQAASSTTSTSAESSRMEVDAEGYPRPIPDDGVASSTAKPLGPQGAESEEGQGWKWSTKEWVKRVEEVYWQHTGMPSSSEDIAAQAKAADEMCEVIVAESCRGDEGQRARWEMLRTSFRKVEGDVLGGEGITLDAVKW